LGKDFNVNGVTFACGMSVVQPTDAEAKCPCLYNNAGERCKEKILLSPEAFLKAKDETVLVVGEHQPDGEIHGHRVYLLCIGGEHYQLQALGNVQGS